MICCLTGISSTLVKPLGAYFRYLDPVSHGSALRRRHDLGCQCIRGAYEEDDSHCPVSYRVRSRKYNFSPAIQAGVEGEARSTNFRYYSNISIQPRYRPTWVILLVVCAQR